MPNEDKRISQASCLHGKILHNADLIKMNFTTSLVWQVKYVMTTLPYALQNHSVFQIFVTHAFYYLIIPFYKYLLHILRDCPFFSHSSFLCQDQMPLVRFAGGLTALPTPSFIITSQAYI